MSTRTPVEAGSRRRTVRDIALVAFGKYGQYLVTLITLPLIARILGPSGLGLLAIGMSSFFIGSLLGTWGSPPMSPPGCTTPVSTGCAGRT